MEPTSLQQPVMAQEDRHIASEIAMSRFNGFFPPPLLYDGSNPSKALHQGGISTDLSHGNKEIQDDGTTEQNVGPKSQSELESSPIRELMEINQDNLVNVCQDAFVGTRNHGQENVSTNQNLSAESITENLSYQQIMEMLPQDDAIDSGKQGNVRTSEIDYGISREDLEKHAGKRLRDVANIYGISPSTLKQICRKNSIFRWPVRGVNTSPESKGRKFRRFLNPQLSPFPIQEVGSGMRFSSGTWNANGSHHSTVLPNSPPSSAREMSLGMEYLNLDLGNGVTKYNVAEPSLPFSPQT